MDSSPRLVALTGGPCSGKTTLLRALARRGWATVREAATDVLRSGGVDPRRKPLRRPPLSAASGRDPRAGWGHSL